MRVYRLSPMAQDRLRNAFAYWRMEGLLVKAIGQWALVDRLGLDAERTAKNFRSRWQIINANQSEYMLFRSKREALAKLVELNAAELREYFA